MSGCGFTVYGRIAVGLRWRPETNGQLAARHGMHPITMRRVTRCLLDLGVIHIDGEAKLDPHRPGFGERVYREGHRPDKGLPSRVRPAPQLIAFASLWKALHKPHSVAELAQVTGLCKRSIYRLFADARRPDAKYVRVCEWRAGVAIFRLGAQADAAPQSNAESMRRYRQTRAKEREHNRALHAARAARTARLNGIAANSSIFRFAAQAA